MAARRATTLVVGGPLFPLKTTHGHARGGVLTVEYEAWRHMRRRCYDKKNVSYPRYGAIGATVCEEWRSDFRQFLRDMGPRPSCDHSLDRIDNFKPYSKENCRWATYKEQARNRRFCRLVEYKGRHINLAQIAEEEGATYSQLYWYHIVNSIPIAEAIRRATRKYGRK